MKQCGLCSNVAAINTGGPIKRQDMLANRINLHATVQGYQFLLVLSKSLLYSHTKSLPNNYSPALFRFTVDWDCLIPQKDEVGNHKLWRPNWFCEPNCLIVDGIWSDAFIAMLGSPFFLSVQWQSYRLDNPGFDCRQRQNVSSPKRPDRFWAPSSHPYNSTWGVFLEGRAVDE